MVVRLFKILLLSGGIFYPLVLGAAETSNVHLTRIEQLKKTIADSEDELVQIVKEEEKNYQWIQELKETLISLKQKQMESTDALKYQQQKLSKLLRAFKTLSTNTSLVVFASCKSREDLVYTGIILNKTVKHLKEMALDLRQELSEIENSKEQITFAEENLNQALKNVHQKKNNLEHQLKTNVLKLKEMVRLSSKETQEKLAVALNAKQKTKSSDEKLLKKPQLLLDFTWPLMGKVIRPYGNHPDFLIKGKGIVIEVNKTAPVVCPQEGLVTKITEDVAVGYIIMITHHQGYQTVLSGIDTLHCYQGQKLQKGQIIGIVEGTLLRSPQLYVQLKCYGKGENPLLFYSKE